MSSLSNGIMKMKHLHVNIKGWSKEYIDSLLFRNYKVQKVQKAEKESMIKCQFEHWRWSIWASFLEILRTKISGTVGIIWKWGRSFASSDGGNDEDDVRRFAVSVVNNFVSVINFVDLVIYEKSSTLLDFVLNTQKWAEIVEITCWYKWYL